VVNAACKADHACGSVDTLLVAAHQIPSNHGGGEMLLLLLLTALLPLTKQLTPTMRASDEPQLVVVIGLRGSGTRAVSACHATTGRGVHCSQCLTQPAEQS
jgi:hypothetical protein